MRGLLRSLSNLLKPRDERANCAYAVGMDLLTTVLEQTQLRGEVYCQTAARPPWGMRFGARPQAMFHAITDGACWLLLGKRRVQLAAGDLVLFSRGSGHALADDPRRPLVDLDDWLASTAYVAGGESTFGGQSGPRTRVLCGAYAFNVAGPHHPVLRVLPELLHLTGDQIRERPDLTATIASLSREQASVRSGTSLVVSRLLDVLFVQMLRTWTETQPGALSGWIGALQDSVLARALAALHGDLAKDWSIDSLARAAGTSRATLGRRFTIEIGESPVAYLARARMQEAARQLQASDDALAQVARSVGYTSEFAFNRAFRRAIGEPPGAYRDRARI